MLGGLHPAHDLRDVPLVGKEGEGKVVLLAETSRALRAVPAHAEHDGAGARELAPGVADPARLRRASRRVFGPVAVGFRCQRTMDPLNVPELSCVIPSSSRVMFIVKLPVAPAKRPVPPVMV